MESREEVTLNKIQRRELWTATSVRIIQTLMEGMLLIVLTFLTVNYLPVLNTVVTAHHTMKQLIHSCVPHCLETVKGSLLPNPICHMLILSYQPHPLPLLCIPQHHLLSAEP